MLCAFTETARVSIGSKKASSDTVELEKKDENLKKIAPFFGHPLSLLLNDAAPLIVEGADDLRVWRQAVRTSEGAIKVFPVEAKSVDVQDKVENYCKGILEALYENPQAYSIRDGDDHSASSLALDHRGPIKRYRLKCYAIENTLLTDSCLTTMGLTWDEFINIASKRISEIGAEEHRDLLKKLISSKDRLRHENIKCLRDLILDIAKCKKEWEKVVGQSIGRLTCQDLTTYFDSDLNPNSLIDFLGVEVVKDVVLGFKEG